jgi:hypothetical protein
MRVALPVAALALLAFTALVLFLNTRENDVYAHGALTPPEADVDPPPWLPRAIAHPCPECVFCVHVLEIARCRLVTKVVDRDGWYRLFWAGSETYYFTDPAYLVGALNNATCGAPEGEWVIEGRYAPWPRDAHDCPPAAGAFRLRFALRYGDFPGESPTLDPTKSLGLPRNAPWFRRRALSDRTAAACDFWWELQEFTAGAAPCCDAE